MTKSVFPGWAVVFLPILFIFYCIFFPFSIQSSRTTWISILSESYMICLEVICLFNVPERKWKPNQFLQLECERPLFLWGAFCNSDTVSPEGWLKFHVCFISHSSHPLSRHALPIRQKNKIKFQTGSSWCSYFMSVD